MENKNLFTSIMGKLLPKADAVNAAGGQAYASLPNRDWRNTLQPDV